MQRIIQVYADWSGIPAPVLLGELTSNIVRGKEVFSFSYNEEWLTSPYAAFLDPDLQLYKGPQYLQDDKVNFGLFLDSSPDRWGRVLMRRREAALARTEKRKERTLQESDYLLGVYDGHRIGGLRFKLDDGPFLDNNEKMAAPPWTSLRELEQASLLLERDDASEDSDYLKWLNLLVAPGSSLGGARPKASVLDQKGALWIAKFPSQADTKNVGVWAQIANELAALSGIQTAQSMASIFSSRHHTFLTSRFDWNRKRQRIHFASAMTLLGFTDGTDHSAGASYLDIAQFIEQYGGRPDQDLRQLWMRIVFNICISNTDDHLRNHGFLLTNNGWILSPVYDLNPNEMPMGLTLNISENDNSLDLDLAGEVAPFFRVTNQEAGKTITAIRKHVSKWQLLAKKYRIPRSEQDFMARAFGE